MIDPAKCRAAVPATGGRPKQCPLVYTQSKILRPDDKTGIETVSLCDRHATELATRLLITLYRETASGGQPVRAKYA